MIGTILYSSKIRYGKNKRNIPYYLFCPDENDQENTYMVASKLGKNTRIDHYAKVEIIDVNCTPVRCAIQEIYGPVNSIESCTKFILNKFNILPRKPIEFEKLENNEVREDLTSLECYSIDPEGTLDIDDAFHFKVTETNLELGIHITDISNIEISKENFDNFLSNASTFYLKEIKNMINLSLFKENLSNDIGSLLKNKNRDCISLIITFGEDIKYKFIKSIISNKHVITYYQADRLIERNSEFKNFVSILETKWGEIKNSHILIEKMMIFYNHKMAEFLKGRNICFPIRTHEGINKEYFEKYKLIENTNILESQQMDDVLKKICYHSAEYVNSEKCIQPHHYGLDISLYTHATSPLRRVNDYLVQHIFSHNKLYDIDSICCILNNRSGDIKKAYRYITKIKLMENLISSNERVYDANIIKFDEGQIYVYINDLDIIHPIRIFSKLSEIINTVLTDTSICIIHSGNGNKITINLLDKVKVKIMITPYESNFNKKIRLFLIEPNLIDIID